MLRKMKAGETSQSIPIFVQDSSSSTGAGLGSLVFGTSGLVAKYRRQGQNAWTTITLATMTLGTWATGGFIADGGGVTGGYELGLPDAAIASAAGVEWVEVQLYGATNMLAVWIFIELDQFDYRIPQYSRFGTAQAGAAQSITLDAGASATNNLYDPSLIFLIAGTGAGQFRTIIDYNGTSKVAVVDRAWRTNPDNTTQFVILPSDNLFSVNEGMAQGGGASTITLNALASAVNDSIKGQWVFIRGGTGSDQCGMIQSYVGATKVATMATAWATAPDATSVYMLLPASFIVGLGTDGVSAASVSAAAASKIAGAVWDETRAAHVTAGTFGSGVPTTYQLRKNVAFNRFPFVMTDVVTHVPLAGLTVTATRSLDGAAFAACANAPVNVGNGAYYIDLAAADTNGNSSMYRFTATGADDREIGVIFQTA